MTDKEKSSNRIVIVGAGISGVSAAESARKTDQKARITIVSREPELPYYRISLTRFLAGELSEEQLPLHPQQWYDERRLQLLRGVEVTAIDVANKILSLGNQDTLPYDRLVLSMGAHAFIPPLQGGGKKNIEVLRTRKDAEAILEKAYTNRHCLIIGGGVLGLETAAALVRRGMDVTVVEAFAWLLPRQLNRPAGERLSGYVESLGIRLICGARIEMFAGEEAVTAVVLESGETLSADMVIVTAGIRCNSSLARQADLKVNKGIVVDSRMGTCDADIYAAGDVAEHRGIVYGAWMPALQQGRVAGINAAGGTADFPGVAPSYIIKVLDIDLFSIGEIHPADGSCQVFEEHDEDRYACFVFQNFHLVGAILMGDTSLSPRIRALIENRVRCREILIEAGSGRDIRERLQAGVGGK
ncbi:MAG: hypothetical protein PWP34_481 [Desulfuromonadales bacterium]|jgi:nitrite reductase (NADH) large subunit|nr:hypothetical protein [Desulfuromonadales bacterium]